MTAAKRSGWDPLETPDHPRAREELARFRSRLRDDILSTLAAGSLSMNTSARWASLRSVLETCEGILHRTIEVSPTHQNTRAMREALVKSLADALGSRDLVALPYLNLLTWREQTLDPMDERADSLNWVNDTLDELRAMDAQAASPGQQGTA